jgi:hypothetical protein
MPKTINLRDLPDELVRKAKSRAALQGVTLKDFVLTAIERATELDGQLAAPMAMSMMRVENKKTSGERKRTKR